MRNLVKAVSIASLLITNVYAESRVQSDCEAKVIEKVQSFIGHQELTLISKVSRERPQETGLGAVSSTSNKYIEFTLSNGAANLVAAEVALSDYEGSCVIQDMVLNEISIDTKSSEEKDRCTDVVDVNTTQRGTFKESYESIVNGIKKITNRVLSK